MIEQQKVAANFLQVKDMNAQCKNFDCEVIVLQPDNEPTGTRDGDVVYKFLVADRTGSVVMTVWGTKGSEIKNGDILRLSGVKCKLKRVGQDTLPFVEKPNMSEKEYVKPVINQLQQQKPYNRNHRPNNNPISQQGRMNRIRYHQDLDNPV
ncbi:hypothetical protein RO3G_01757 [Rhizopus delemar RA 99-880]|uniref:OB domain-containing protein n=1 Tax=Rhizopus delemar (strain RA 99-880 / ATCC MYA-4621 / FGSC 9543 / NRRL 43880) TaxID=246409 RepID=I1BLH3_RHIO9|nr:hypothetical protein RO3G_01757 [Rhizopus delemar RA 99-880]|eukprot:EIE77053.1 hypothetical protein RO3G_01757 [Rhizopus delemar RA 99-880]